LEYSREVTISKLMSILEHYFYFSTARPYSAAEHLANIIMGDRSTISEADFIVGCKDLINHTCRTEYDLYSRVIALHIEKN